MKKLLIKMLMLFIISCSLTSCSNFFISRDILKEFIQDVSGMAGADVQFYEEKINGQVVEHTKYYTFYNEYYNEIGLYTTSVAGNESFTLQTLFPQTETPITSHIKFIYSRGNKKYFEAIGTIEHRKLTRTTPFVIHGYIFFDGKVESELYPLLNIANNALYYSVYYFGKYLCPYVNLTLKDFRFDQI